MARALLSQKPIILLDEPTAHLDIETEYEIKQVMLNVFKDKLVFFATHRVHWMKSMDHLLVLREGKLVEQGTHASLGLRPSFYKQLTGLEVEIGRSHVCTTYTWPYHLTSLVRIQIYKSHNINIIV